MAKNKINSKQVGDKSVAKFAEKPYIDETGMEITPANGLMKKVAESATDIEKMKQSFTPKEIQIILDKKRQDIEVSKNENTKLNKTTRVNKRWVKNRAAGDYSRIFLYPSYTSKDGKVWYKMIDFSALFFVYRLSDRMGMSVNIFPDKDNYAKSDYTASIQDIEKVAEEFMRLGGKKVETTATGIYILTLPKPMTADNYAELLKQEAEKRDRMHNLLKPAAMAPATHKMFIDVVRQFGPKIQKLEKRNFFAIGENMMRTLEEILKVYYLYSDGIYTMEKAGWHLIAYLDKLRADLFILQELDAWNNLATAAMMGELLVRLREQVLRDFRIKVGRQEAGQC